jgi:hypothetical protein
MFEWYWNFCLHAGSNPSKDVRLFSICEIERVECGARIGEVRVWVGERINRNHFSRTNTEKIQFELAGKQKFQYSNDLLLRGRRLRAGCEVRMCWCWCFDHIELISCCVGVNFEICVFSAGASSTVLLRYRWGVSWLSSKIYSSMRITNSFKNNRKHSRIAIFNCIRNSLRKF